MNQPARRQHPGPTNRQKDTALRPTRLRLAPAACALALLCALSARPQDPDAPPIRPIPIGRRLELFVDRLLIDKLDGAALRLHEPQRQPRPQSPLPIAYTTVIKDGDLYRAYYRDYRKGYSGPWNDGNPGEITCYAESRDGCEWRFPDLGVCDVESPRGRNVIWDGADACSHNFCPFLDARPGTPRSERFKALGGTKGSGGLYAFASPDGVHWRKLRDKPVITSTDYAFDSQNVSFWSEAESRYVCYFRSWRTPHGRLRTVSRTTSEDFLRWAPPVPTNPNRPGEHLYTSQTHPYFRAPHIYIALPTRFMPNRGNSTDILFMAARAGDVGFARLFVEAFIRPGLDPARWGNRANYVALNVVPAGPAEMSIYHKDGCRYTLRIDGFISVRAGAAQGELLTKPLTFSGSRLFVNYSCSAAGSLRAEIRDSRGAPIPGFRLEDCPPIIGDKIRQRVRWKGDPDLSQLAGAPVRLRFVMTECDLYAFRFGDEEEASP